MRLSFFLPSLTLAIIRGVSSAAHVCPDNVTIQPLVFVQKTSVYASSHICEETTLALAGTNIPITHVPTIVETSFEITNTVTASVTLSSWSGPGDADGSPCPVSDGSPCPFGEHDLAKPAPQGQFTTLTALCSNDAGSTLTIPPPGNGRFGTKVVLLPTNNVITGTYDEVTQTWSGISGSAITTIIDDSDNGSTPTTAVLQPTSDTSNQISSDPASGATVTTIPSTPVASLSDLSSAVTSSTSDEPSSGAVSPTISPSSNASSSEPTSPTISSSSTASSSEATSPISSSSKASLSEATSPTISSSSNALSSGETSVTTTSSLTESSPSTISSHPVSSLESLTTAPPEPSSSPSSSSSSSLSTIPASSTSQCVITATPVPECCMNELPDGCQALENTNGLALEPVIQACEEALGKYATEDMLQCWEGDIRDESKGTYIADCLLYELESCCITELPEACSRLSGATGSAVPSGAAECRDALGIFVHGIASPCLDQANVTDETQGNSIVDCLEVAYGLRSGPVTIVDNKICPTTAIP
ncbi:unnamed protein product [Clonostachys byssicola]|uniref:Uncharacterized protein n=1 Tax=Clonostachys byssicola TaxID=160290 RepID=A0A9N9UJ47_9HYPO|nr:unnamed protein product [Clonostachys byssicola]